ncbi:hypothetical protein EV363DRAFT_1455774 [Boletus edulis]|nr:hypothetical protein EV363DRAFT_1496171 [Boletus edulis]KAF8123163.1 hypothetical protein EV363DRAFT_1455774 [Boletus edulis]
MSTPSSIVDIATTHLLTPSSNIRHSRMNSWSKGSTVKQSFTCDITAKSGTWHLCGPGSIGKQEEALNILKAGTEVNLTSFLLHFAHAEAQEGRKKYGEVTATFASFLTTYMSNSKSLRVE